MFLDWNLTTKSSTFFLSRYISDNGQVISDIQYYFSNCSIRIRLINLTKQLIYLYLIRLVSFFIFLVNTRVKRWLSLGASFRSGHLSAAPLPDFWSYPVSRSSLACYSEIWDPNSEILITQTSKPIKRIWNWPFLEAYFLLHSLE